MIPRLWFYPGPGGCRTDRIVPKTVVSIIARNQKWIKRCRF